MIATAKAHLFSTFVRSHRTKQCRVKPHRCVNSHIMPGAAEQKEAWWYTSWHLDLCLSSTCFPLCPPVNLNMYLYVSADSLESCGCSCNVLKFRSWPTMHPEKWQSYLSYSKLHHYITASKQLTLSVWEVSRTDRMTDTFPRITALFFYCLAVRLWTPTHQHTPVNLHILDFKHTYIFL